MAENLSQLKSDAGWAKANKWAISYADMVTLLLTFFVLLLVILNEEEKIVEMEISKLLSETEEVLKKNIRTKIIEIERQDKGVKITLRGNIFPSASNEIKKGLYPLLTNIGGVTVNAPLFTIFSKDSVTMKKRKTLIKRLRDKNDTLLVEIRVEGHTDDLPLPKGYEYNNNWELSSARALSMVQLLAQITRLDPSKFSALGYGEYRPLIDVSQIRDKKERNKARATNRRVEIYLTATVQKKKVNLFDEVEINVN
ncbi:MAG: flagellar motor protein MotB [Candidatus Neomarinimicrobiota bacterium]